MKKLKKKNDGYDWKFCTIGGVTRVSIQSGKDIAHLGELDQKLWTVLSCPATGLEFDSKTLALLDTDGDGKVKVNEVIAAAKWLTSVIKDPDLLLKKEDTCLLESFNTENEDGKKLHDSAKQILANLGLEKDSISLADSSDSVAIFAKTRFNGDGIVTPASTDDEGLKKLITDAVACVGGATDRSGEAGVNAELVEKFYAACADYAAWQEAGVPEIYPYGDNTQAALDACNALKDKISDYFMRCKLASFNDAATAALDVNPGKFEAISEKNLASCPEEISNYPLARIVAGDKLPFAGINPAWQGAFATLKSLVLDVDFPEADGITEAQWQATLAKFSAFTAWKDAKKGSEVEALGLDAVKAVLAEDRKAALMELIDSDKALEAEAGAIDMVDKFMHLYRYFYQFLCNFVTFSDFYSRKDDRKAVFQAGKLYVDQRCCDLCIEVTDMGKHGDMAGQSGMYILYCNCVSKVKNATKTIAAVLTDGDVDNLREGKNCIFYDREGQDWDATVIKIVENPISVRQAFWSPYKKLARFVETQVNKMAADKDSKVMADATAKVGAPADPAAPKQPFDIAKFAGIFAAIGLAVGALGAALGVLVKSLAALAWWKLLIVIVAVLLVISGPAMIMAWLKLRRRNLAPVLNANGWAINSHVLVNILFGATLTSMAKYPKVVMKDPYSKKMAAWKKWLISIAVILVAAFCALFFTDTLKCIGLPFHKDKVEAVEAAPGDETAPADTLAVAPAPEETPAE